MSYILEALKKAQAERQLGDTPNIHAPPPSYAAPGTSGTRKPLLIGLGAGTAIVAAGAILLMRPPAPAPVVQTAGAPAAVPVPGPVPAPVPAPVAAPVAAAPEPVTPPPPVEPVKPKAAPLKARPQAPAPVAEPAPRVETVLAAPEAPRPAIVAPAPAPAPAPTADDGVGPLQSLPEAVQREVPKVAVGGYIYSPNPAERLLLVDKMLRREGEEVAPGLVLERLLPKAAIMNYRGYRYRVGY